MQSTSTLYNSLLSNPSHIKEVRIDINGVSYDEGAIVRLTTNSTLFSQNTPVVGSCVASEIDVMLLPSDAVIPKMATLRPYIRLSAGGQVSEWIPKGVYYIDTRETDPESGVLTIHGFDAMLKADQYYLTTTNDAYNWPLAMQTVVNEIAGRMGLEIDDRTVINSAYTMAKPSHELTMRDVLGYIGAAHGGNWIVTDAGELRLIGLADIPEDSNLLTDDFGNPLLFGEVRIVLV